MELAWIGYNSLRRDLMAPRGAIDQYYPLIWEWHNRTGRWVHWMGIKRMIENCHIPLPGAEEDEVRAHQMCIHYGDRFKDLMHYVNKAPTQGRFAWLQANPFPVESLGFEIPYVDVAYVEATGQMGAAYGQDYILQLLWKRNPNIGFIILDQDLARASPISKLKKWHPNPEERFVIATNYPTKHFPRQAVMLTPHLKWREQEPLLRNDSVAYIGNDYKRREPMRRLMMGPRFHHYGAFKPGEDGTTFEAELNSRGTVVHGPFVPSPGTSIENVYRLHGAGLHIAREDAYSRQIFTSRWSEVARAGVIGFCDRRLAIGKAFASDWCCVETKDELLGKLDALPQSPAFWESMIRYQQQAMEAYAGVDRYVEAIQLTVQRLMEGPIRGTWHLNLYNDLCNTSGLPTWGGPGCS